MNRVFIKAQMCNITSVPHDFKIPCKIPCLQMDLLLNMHGTNG